MYESFKSYGIEIQREDEKSLIEHFDESLRHAIEFINENGPFEGFAGFSQGSQLIKGILNSSKLSLDLPSLLHPPLFTINFCGVEPTDMEQLLPKDEDVSLLYSDSGVPSFCIYGALSPFLRSEERFALN